VTLTTTLHTSRTQNKKFWNGDLDEVRIAGTARSAGWIRTAYENQLEPEAFARLGDLEAL
jgi:hypothetical protein